MSEKKSKNKFKELMSDYYLTNRKVEKANDKALKEQEKIFEEDQEKGSFEKRKEWSSFEKRMIFIIIVGAIGIIIKYIFFR